MDIIISKCIEYSIALFASRLDEWCIPFYLIIKLVVLYFLSSVYAFSNHISVYMVDIPTMALLTRVYLHVFLLWCIYAKSDHTVQGRGTGQNIASHFGFKMYKLDLNSCLLHFNHHYLSLMFQGSIEITDQVSLLLSIMAVLTQLILKAFHSSRLNALTLSGSVCCCISYVTKTKKHLCYCAKK